VILIPEIPYDEEKIAEAILQRSRGGKRFSIVAVSEGAMPIKIADQLRKAEEKLSKAESKKERKTEEEKINTLEMERTENTIKLTRKLEELTGLESRVTILGYLQRGGAPSAADRLLATRLGTACARLLSEEQYGDMVA
jgi:6-phosphofructokinase 1